MKSKAVLFILLVLATTVSLLGCGGGGGSSNPASPDKPLATVTGVVKDLNGDLVKGAYVRMAQANSIPANIITDNVNLIAAGISGFACRMAAGAFNEFETTTDAQGRYTFENVPEGEYTLTVNTPNMAQIVSRLAVETGIPVEVSTIVLKPMGTVTGKVKLGDADVAGVLVYAEGTSFGSYTDSKGEYTITGIPVTEQFTFCVQSSQGTAESQQATVPNLASLTAVLNFTLTATSEPTDDKACHVVVSLSTPYHSWDIASCTVLFIGSYTTYVGKCTSDPVDNTIGTCSIDISRADTYRISPAYNDIAIDNAIVENSGPEALPYYDLVVNDEMIQNSKQIDSISFGIRPSSGI